MDGENFARLRFGGWLLGDGMALLAAVFGGVLGRCGANHWRALDFTAAGACFRGYFLHGGRMSKNVCKCLILLWLGCPGWVWRLGLDLLVFQLRTTSDARGFSNEVLDYEGVSLSSCVSTHHRTIAP